MPSLRFRPSQSTWHAADVDSATLVRGVDKHHHFDLEPRPQHDLDDAALAAHKDAIDRQVTALYQGTDKKAFRA